jgi:hypothetical protein
MESLYFTPAVQGEAQQRHPGVSTAAAALSGFGLISTG